MSLDTLANVKTRLGITTASDDSLLALLQNSADRWLSNYLDRDFGGGTYTEYFPGGTLFLHLRNYPVQSVTSVKVDPAYGFGADTVVSSSSYVVHPDRGVIQALLGPFVPPTRQGLVNAHVTDWTRAPRAVQVVYVVAAGAAPDDILAAYACLLGHWYRQIKTQVNTGQLNVVRQHLGEFETIYTAEQIAGLPVPPDLFVLLAAYRTPCL
jgi:hypothetical protein